MVKVKNLEVVGKEGKQRKGKGGGGCCARSRVDKRVVSGLMNSKPKGKRR